MKLDRVTITGADDSIDPQDLLPLTKKHPFVEWGILYSAKRQGSPRYPNRKWLNSIALLQRTRYMGEPNRHPLNLSAHLCGKWVRDLVLDGETTWWMEGEPFPDIFKRVQLNFHGEYHKACAQFPRALKTLTHDFILQHDGVNDETILKLGADLPVSPLFDRSGGAGVLPKSWPAPIWKYQGYAGGLSPENVALEIPKILAHGGNSSIWIDTETRVRSEDDSTFDLKKVDAFLAAAAPFVDGAATRK